MPEAGTPKNYRNGYSKKTVKTQLGEVDVKIPRDRNGEYEPQIIGKYNRNADGMEKKIPTISSTRKALEIAQSQVISRVFYLQFSFRYFLRKHYILHFSYKM